MSTDTKKKLSNSKQTQELHRLIIEAISDKKGQKTVSLDLRKVEDTIADYFIVCEADNMTQVKAIADQVNYSVKQELSEYPLHTEGLNNLEWVLIDYFDIVVHVFYHEKRGFYEIEELWSDAEITEYDTD